LSPINILSRGDPTHRLCTALIAGLPGEIAVRELAICRNAFDWPEEAFKIRQLSEACGPGNVVMIEIGSEQVTEVFTAVGQRGVRAEAVAEQCLQEARAYLASGAPVGEHLADQLLIPFAIAGKGAYVTGELSQHTRTNMEVVQRFLAVKINAEKVADKKWRVEIGQ
jgi:RNA 3'-terminal phosphate cyclase (ATP)